MPTKIVSTKTSSLAGEITGVDRDKMKQEFQQQVKLSSENIGWPVEKKFGWFVTREEINQLFELNANAAGELPVLLQINFAVNLNDKNIIDDCGNVMANLFTVVLETTGLDKLPVQAVDEYVLVPGFNNYPVLPALAPTPASAPAPGPPPAPSPACCPSSYP